MTFFFDKQSRVHINTDKVFFQDSEETIHSAEINDSSYESQADFHLGKKMEKQNKTKMTFSRSIDI